MKHILDRTPIAPIIHILTLYTTRFGWRSDWIRLDSSGPFFRFPKVSTVNMKHFCGIWQFDQQKISSR